VANVPGDPRLPWGLQKCTQFIGSQNFSGSFYNIFVQKLPKPIDFKVARVGCKDFNFLLVTVTIKIFHYQTASYDTGLYY